MAILVSKLTASEQALQRARDHTGYAFACMFSTADEFEADIVRVRRAQGAYRQRSISYAWLRFGGTIAVLALLFLTL